jgi:hypothetical protein
MLSDRHPRQPPTSQNTPRRRIPHGGTAGASNEPAQMHASALVTGLPKGVGSKKSRPKAYRDTSVTPAVTHSGVQVEVTPQREASDLNE